MRACSQPIRHSGLSRINAVLQHVPLLLLPQDHAGHQFMAIVADGHRPEAMVCYPESLRPAAHWRGDTAITKPSLLASEVAEVSQTADAGLHRTA